LRTGLVLDDHSLLQIAAEIFADQPAEHVGRAARGIGNDKFYRAGRIVGSAGILCRGNGSDDRETAGQC
jgi:hypothetical protein